MDDVSISYMSWFEKWLNDYEVDHQRIIDGDIKPFVNYSSANSLCEVALEIYNVLRTKDLSLDQLNQYINQIGNIISQVNLKAIVSQSRLMYNQMLSVVFDNNDGSNSLLECNKEDSYAYVYLLIRLLHEILLYTRSTAVRSFVYYQLVRNKKVLKCLFGLIYQPCTIPRNIGYDSSNDDDFFNSSDSIDADVNQLNQIGYPSSNFVSNVFDNIFMQLLQTHELNLRIICIKLLSLCPSLVLNNPQILNELKLNLMDADDELSYITSITLSEIIFILPEEIILQILNLSFDNAVGNKENPQRLQSFVFVCLGCNYVNFNNIKIKAYRMCWILWMMLDKYHSVNDAVSTIITEQQYYLMIVSTLICLRFPYARTHQKERLESLMQDKDLKFRDCLIYCLNLIYTTAGHSMDLIESTHNLLKDEPTESHEELMNLVRYQLMTYQLKLYTKNSDVKLFNDAMQNLYKLLEYDVNNMTILPLIKEAFAKLEKFRTDNLIMLLNIIQSYISKCTFEIRCKIFHILSAIIRWCYIRDTKSFTSSIGRINEIIKYSDLKILIRPLLHLQNIDFDAITCRMKSTHLVNLVYDIVSNERGINGKYKVKPIYVDLMTNKMYKDKNSVTVAMYGQKPGWGLEYRKILLSQLKELSRNIDSGKDMYYVMQLCLRFRFYKEASGCLKRLIFWTDNTLLWFNALYYHSMSEDSDLIDSIRHRKSCIDSLEAFCTKQKLEIERKINYQLWNTNINHYTPVPILYMWSVLKLGFDVAVGHFNSILSQSPLNIEDIEKCNFQYLFVSFKMQFKILKLMFQSFCHETTFIFNIYECLAIILVHISKSIHESPTRQVNDIFKDYMTKIIPNVRMPDTYQILISLTNIHHRLSSNKFYHKNLLSTSFIPPGSQITSNDKFDQIEGKLSLEAIWSEMVMNYKCKTKERGEDDSAIHFYLRDIPLLQEFNNLLLQVQGAENIKIATTITSKLLNYHLATPIGIIKAYPLPFAAITATFFTQRAETTLQTVKFDGIVRNIKSNHVIHFVLITLEKVDSRESEILYKGKFKLRNNTINTTCLLRLTNEESKNVRIVAIPIDDKYNPKGLPCNVYFIQKFV